MNAIKICELEPHKTYYVDQWTLKKSKFGDCFLIKVHEKNSDASISIWSNAQLFHELTAISSNKVNFSKLLNFRYSFKIVAESEYNGNKTVELETKLD